MNIVLCYVAPAPAIANLPFTIEVQEMVDIPPGETIVETKEIFTVLASHEKNNVLQENAWWNPVPVSLKFTSPDDAFFNITTNSPATHSTVYEGN